MKKRSKKLLFIWLRPFGTQRAQTRKSFLVLFFKKNCFYFISGAVVTDLHDAWVQNTFGVDPAAYAAPPPGALGNVEGFAKGTAEGVVEGVGGMVSGLWGAATGTFREAHALATDGKARGRAEAAIAGGAKAVGEFAGEIVNDPSRAGSDVWQAAKSGAAAVGQAVAQEKADYEVASAQGHGAEFVGKALGEGAVLVASVVIPGAVVAKGAEAASVLAGASATGRILATGEIATELGRTERIGESVAKIAGGTGKAAAAPVDAVKLAKAKADLAPLMQQAEAGKAMIDRAADATAAKFGGAVSKAPVKSVERAAKKAVLDYDGDVRRVQDLARNTVIVGPDKTAAAIDDIVKKMKVQARHIKRTTAEHDPLGYSGAIINVEQANGMLAEIQVNSPEMIFAKEPEVLAEHILGSALFSKIKSVTGLPGGQGHKFYEVWRQLPVGSAEADRIAAMSRAYYARVRAKAKSIDWTSIK